MTLDHDTQGVSQQPGPPASQGAKHSVWFGPNGLRAGWRLVIYAIPLITLGFGVNFTLHRMFGPSLQSAIGQNPWAAIFLECLNVVLFVGSALVMARLEKRSFADYGLGWRSEGIKRFAEGTLWGFTGLSCLLLLMHAFGVFSYGRFTGFGTQTLYYGLLWGICFLLVGFAEEFGFRGYIQYTLTSGISFWPAALVTSGIFLLAHTGNQGETPVGLAQVFMAGFLLVVALRRTGALWFSMGIHLGWDWGQSFFYGVPDSGLITRGHMFEGQSHGAAWLSGGTTGPEGSLFALLVELAFVPLILWRFRSAKYPDPASLPKRPGAVI
ncbi:MAG TPA: CPBP family intramembrane glutamic endopeptidase [Terriglobales bacterium]|nr:CPBP family intramembrane glutamic endopeptidase [Terriglobales bacterium]